NNVTQIDTAQIGVAGPRPVVDLGPDLTITQGQSATFTATVDNLDGVTIDWDFEYDGAFDPDPSAHNVLTTSHQYLAAGTHFAAMQAVNSTGAATLRYVIVEVNNVPPTAVVTNSGPIPEGAYVTFTVSNVASIDPNAYFDYLADWDGDGP